MQSIEDRISTNISKRGRGTIVSPLDYAGYGDSKAVQKAFERLTATEKLIRVARGVYCYPKIDKVLGLGILYPTIEEIATAIARRDKADKVKYILGIYRGIVRIVIDVKGNSLCSVADDGTVFKKPRFAFVGDIVPDSPYLNTDVTDYPFGSGGAITYIPRINF